MCIDDLLDDHSSVRMQIERQTIAKAHNPNQQLQREGQKKEAHQVNRTRDEKNPPTVLMNLVKGKMMKTKKWNRPMKKRNLKLPITWRVILLTF